MVSAELIKKYKFKDEVIEQGRDNKGNSVWERTGFPEPAHRYRLVYQVFNQSIEEFYFWILEHIRQDQGFHDITKITDIFSASEQSSFFGSAMQRLGLQQDRVSQFLATIGKMIKDLFQLVRELRVIDERLSYYESSLKRDKAFESAEITLKGLWIDLVEQGSKNPASVYGMARELQFTTLPDLFFSIHPTRPAEVDAMVDKLDFNRKVKEVLRRKLRQFLEWKVSTHKELKVRRTFTLKYLRQHFDVIKMYMNWVKPYLKNIQRMQLSQSHDSPDLISAFEGALVEIELLAKMFPRRKEHEQPMEQNQHIYSVLIAHFVYRATPTMNYQTDYQRGPQHMGMTDFTIRAYAWNKKEIQNYLAMKEEEDMELLGSVDASIKAAMEALGEDLEAYLREAGEEVNFKKEMDDEPKKPKQSLFEPFTALFSFGGSSKNKGPSKIQLENEKSIAKGAAKGACWQTYKNFKKKEKILAW